MGNRLATALSPYLRQHAGNPVDWWEWSSEAFANARRRDVPVFLSIGYAACHWCHVMAHESFEDPEVAALLNEGFVPVKVDREERPDIDSVYMAATTALTGSGGWPMTVLMNADGEPFWCGTYLPNAQLRDLLEAASRAWADQRGELARSSSRIRSAVRRIVAPQPEVPVTRHTLDLAVIRLEQTFDARNGGFGGAPKFPPSMILEFLLRHHARTGSPEALTMVERTGGAMARGGLYDQLGGGFARYAVDGAWVVPHFEKMLYDNAQLARVYLHWWRATGSALAERVARETCDFLLRDLRTADGGFASSLDADTDGVEGATYVWTRAQLDDALGTADAGRAAELLSVTERGTFEPGASTLQLPRDPDDAAWWAGVRGRLWAVRRARPAPARDDKVVASWNGLAVAALAEAGVLLEESHYLDSAGVAAQLVLSTHLVDGRLRRVSRDGRVGVAPAVADDYGNLAEGLLALHQATGTAHWLRAAGGLLDTAAERFGDGSGVFHDTADDGEALLARPHSSADNAEPSGQSALSGALLTYGALTGSAPHLQLADAGLAVSGSVAEANPRFAGWTLAAAEARAAGPLQVAVVGSGPRAAALAAVARRSASPGLVLVAGLADADGVPLLAGRPLLHGEPAAYVCRGFVCDRPVTTPEELRDALS
jgi:uncharacterized protein YyaL (SSP411 family)